MTLGLGLLSLCGVLSVFLCGCGDLPEPYAPPAQQPVFEAPAESVRVLKMADPGAATHFVQDISQSLEANTWRWTGKRPTVRVFPGSNRKLRYFIDFEIAPATFEQTGPVTVSFIVNDHLLDRIRYTKPGRQLFEKQVPAEWTDPNAYVILAAEIDKLWLPLRRDAPPLGVILMALGLERK